MGIVPENEYALGLECAGIVTRLGKRATKFQQGDRVVALRNAMFANRCRVPEARAQLIPSGMSFDLAATIPIVYCTSLYSMFHLGNLRKGQVRNPCSKFGHLNANGAERPHPFSGRGRGTGCP